MVAGRTTEFHLAARRGDRTKLRRMVADGQDVDAVGKLGETALHLASAEGEVEAAALLRELGADPTCRDRAGRTPDELLILSRLNQPALLLHFAITGDPAAGLRPGNAVDAQDRDGNTALHLAYGGGYPDAAIRLLDLGASTTVRNRYDLTPAQMAMVPECVAWLGELAAAGRVPFADREAIRGLPPGVVSIALLTVALNEKRTRAVLLCGLRLGIRETLGAMTQALDWYGTKWIAEDYLNCGADVLAEAARTWAARNGYEIEYKPHGDTVTWGG